MWETRADQLLARPGVTRDRGQTKWNQLTREPEAEPGGHVGGDCAHGMSKTVSYQAADMHVTACRCSLSSLQWRKGNDLELLGIRAGSTPEECCRWAPPPDNRDWGDGAIARGPESGLLQNPTP